MTNFEKSNDYQVIKFYLTFDFDCYFDCTIFFLNIIPCSNQLLGMFFIN